MRTKHKLVMLYIINGFICLAIFYFLFVLYYYDKFSFGTWINKQYVTGKTVQETNDLLADQMEHEVFTMIGMNGEEVEIKLAQVDYILDFSTQLSEQILKQNPVIWSRLLLEQNKITVEPTIQLNRIKLEKVIEESSIVKNELDRINDVLIVYTENGYELQNTMIDVLNIEFVENAVYDAIKKGEFFLDLEEAGCYGTLDLTAEMKDTMLLFEQIDAFQQTKLQYQFNNKIYKIDPKDTAKWILIDENGDFVLDKNGELQMDENAVAEYVSYLSDTFDTYGKSIEFTTTSGEVKEIEGGTFGSLIDVDAETKYLIDNFLDNQGELHEPIYLKETNNSGYNTIGNTYVEIDLTNQVLYYYEKGNLEIETDIVSGNLSAGHDTPEGVSYVYAKQRNRILRGATYESFVNYWMPVVGGIGIHDASWRSNFGDEIYKTNGSHGCINIPKDIMPDIYEQVDLYTPVVMYY